MILNKDGTYKLRDRVVGGHGDKTVVYVSGEFDTANLTLVYHDDFKNPIPLQDGKLESGKQYLVYDGSIIPLSVILDNASYKTSISVISVGVS